MVEGGIDTDWYYPGAQQEGITNEPLRLPVVGRFHRQKMIPETIQWLAQARRQNVKFLVSIIEDGPERDTVNATILEKNMAEVASLKGWLGMARVWYSRNKLNDFMKMVCNMLKRMQNPYCQQISELDAHRIFDHGVRT